jgi:hypothetical protein
MLTEVYVSPGMQGVFHGTFSTSCELSLRIILMLDQT